MFEPLKHFWCAASAQSDRNLATRKGTSSTAFTEARAGAEEEGLDTFHVSAADGRVGRAVERARHMMEKPLGTSGKPHRSERVLPGILESKIDSALDYSFRHQTDAAMNAWGDVVIAASRYGVTPRRLLNARLAGGETVIERLLNSRDFLSLMVVGSLAPLDAYAHDTIINSSSYIGEIRDGRWHGLGLALKNGLMFCGSFKRGHLHGFAEKRFLHQASRYAGWFVEGVAAGKGWFEFGDGATVDAFFSNDLPHGIGTFKRTDGSRAQVEFLPSSGGHLLRPGTKENTQNY